MNNSPLHIPKPCHEDWSAMTLEEKGRHCAVCSKVVMDFTQMPTDKVVEFISNNTSGKICGRFRKEQVSIPDVTESNYTFLGRMRVFLAALVLVFGSALFSSCQHHRESSHRQGDVRIYDWKQPSAGFKPSLDSPGTQNNDHPKGHVKVATKDQSVKDTAQTVLMGRVAAPK